jgi:NADH dehydrogenase/NADH:ubiquinone oxidoreductase subunit G
MCVVEVNGGQALQTACSTPVAEGMSVRTVSARITRYRRDLLELIFAVILMTVSPVR